MIQSQDNPWLYSCTVPPMSHPVVEPSSNALDKNGTAMPEISAKESPPPYAPLAYSDNDFEWMILL
jgi:hypothetical protein